MIIANYGASQGFDTDDGSSWCATHLYFLFLCFYVFFLKLVPIYAQPEIKEEWASSTLLIFHFEPPHVGFLWVFCVAG
jgi:hypothetical protein